MRLALSLLGPFQASVGERTIADFATDKVRALLAYLVVEGNRPHRRERLAALFWPNLDAARARSNLRLALHRLRDNLDAAEPALSQQVFGITRDTVQVNGAAVDSDVARFLALLDVCELHPHRLLHLCPSCLAQLSEAAALFRGELLAGLYITDAPEFEQWELERREDLDRRLLTLLHHLADAHEQLGDYGRALLFAHRQLALDPYANEAHRQVIRLYARQGQRAAALVHYEHVQKSMAEELGVELDRISVQLAEDVRAGRLTSAQPIGRPLLSNFPAQFTPFFGRAAEIEHLAERLADDSRDRRDVPAERLYTIVAPGGMGKTRLAIAVAEALAERPGYPDGITYVSLARTASAGLLPSALAAALGLSLSGAAQPVDALFTFLRPKRMLLVLDNFEHLVDGAEMIEQLLETAPGLRLLVTSRAALNVRGEERLVLGGMDEASLGRLFISGANRIAPGYDPDPAERAAIAAICRVVGGMPLAVELAATWVRLMDAPAIAAQIRRDLDFLTSTLRDLPPRQRSMRAIFDHMWAQLSPPQAVALAALSVLRGPFRLDAAEDISQASPPVLADLLDGTLLRSVGGGRFELHELLRQYAAEQLAAAPELEVAARARHATHYLALLERRGASLGGLQSREALAALRRNLDNVRLAWQWAVDGGHFDVLAPVALPLEMFYRSSGLLPEGVQTFAATAEALAARLDRGELDPATARPLLYTLWRHEALLRELRGDVAGGLARLEQVRDGWAALGDRRRLAQTLNDLAYVYVKHSRVRSARTPAQKALALGQELNDDMTIADALHNLGNALVAEDMDRGEALLRESIGRYQVVGDNRWLAGALNDLGRVLAFQGDIEAAGAAFRQSLVKAETAGDLPTLALALTNLGAFGLEIGDLTLAEEYSRRGQAVAQEMGDSLVLSVCLGNLAHIALTRGEPAALRLYGDTMVVSLEVDAGQVMAEGLLGLASLTVPGRPADGARWLASSEAWRKAYYHEGVEPFVDALRRKTEARLRAALGVRFDDLWAKGLTMPLAVAAAEAAAWAAVEQYRI